VLAPRRLLPGLAPPVQVPPPASALCLLHQQCVRVHATEKEEEGKNTTVVKDIERIRI
jgi:hypothetical protein